MRFGTLPCAMLRLPLLSTFLICSHASASAQSLFAAYNNGQIEQFSQEGLDQGTAINTGTGFANALAFDPGGNLFVSTIGRVQKFSPTGADLGVFAPTGLTGGIAFDRSGNFYGAYFDRVIKFSPTGTNLGNFATGFVVTIGLAFDTMGNLYVADGYNNTVVKITATGSNAGTFASVSDPNGIAFDSSGNLYTADYGFNVPNAGTVHEFSSTGADLGVFASGLSGTSDLVFDPSGNLYVSNSSSHSIDKYSSSGVHLASFSTGTNIPLGLAFGASIVPEPSSLTLLVGMVLSGAGLLARRRKNARKAA